MPALTDARSVSAPFETEESGRETGEKSREKGETFSRRLGEGSGETIKPVERHILQ
jgi:hypothetical protein